MKTTFEVCAGSLADCLAAQNGGADRIELNSALALGGLSPSLRVLKEAKAQCSIPIICMVRPREAGFHYSPEEFSLMLLEARDFLDSGADGIAFGFLRADGTIDPDQTRQMTELIHSYPDKEAVFHRAIDVVPDYSQAIQTLIDLNVDRILTSGTQSSAPKGALVFKEIQQRYGDQIQILAGAGLNPENVGDFLRQSGIHQVHSSAKSWKRDPTTQRGEVSYSAYPGEHAMDYPCASVEVIRVFRQACDTI